MTSSLSPAPSDDGPFQAMKPSPARPTSVLQHAAYRAHEDAMRAESSTSHRRRHSAIAAPSPQRRSAVTARPFKRVRAATPICDDSAVTDFADPVPNAPTAPAHATTAAATDRGTSAQYLADDERREREVLATSENEEPSVLFSEQGGTRTEPTEAMEDAFFLDELDLEESTAVDISDAMVPAHSSRGMRADRDTAGKVDFEERTLTAEAAHWGSDVYKPSDGKATVQNDGQTSDGLEFGRDRAAEEAYWGPDVYKWLDEKATVKADHRSTEQGDSDERIRAAEEAYWGTCPTNEVEGKTTAAACGSRGKQEKWDEYLTSLSDDEERERAVQDDLFPASSAPSSQRVRTTRDVYIDALERGEEIEYHSGDSEDFEMDHRPVLERAAVKRDIRTFVDSMKVLAEPDEGKRDYQIVDRLGEGTFSSVYLAYDRLHGRYNNDWWTGEEDEESGEHFHSSRHSVKLALKRVLATSSPQRIENELDILESLRGCRNVSQLVTAFREEDQVIIVLPYHRSDDFRHFYRHMDAEHIRSYMRALLRGLADIHARGIIHRDIKPANFLYDYETGDGVVCDFGLAERYAPPRKPSCQHAPAELTSLAGIRIKTNETALVEQAVYDARKRSKLGEGRIGFPQDDKRPAIKTNRAGTRGFRAPEVLLKCPDQTVGAIDVWSAGVMLLSILTHKFPVFNSNDDLEALMELAAMFGRSPMEKVAMLHNRTIMTNCSTIDKAPYSLREMILTINPHLYNPPLSCPTPAEAQSHIESMDFAMDLCTRLLRLDATKRLSAKRALNHEFFSLGPNYEEEADTPILSGVEGKCGHLHSVENGKHQAWFYRDCQDMHFGQGIPSATDKLCPEHEHWQQRTLLNPITTSHHFTEPDSDPKTTFSKGDDDDDDELVVERPVFSLKDPNVSTGSHTARHDRVSARS